MVLHWTIGMVITRLWHECLPLEPQRPLRFTTTGTVDKNRQAGNRTENHSLRAFCPRGISEFGFIKQNKETASEAHQASRVHIVVSRHINMKNFIFANQHASLRQASQSKFPWVRVAKRPKAERDCGDDTIVVREVGTARLFLALNVRFLWCHHSVRKNHSSIARPIFFAITFDKAKKH